MLKKIFRVNLRCPFSFGLGFDYCDDQSRILSENCSSPPTIDKCQRHVREKYSFFKKKQEEKLILYNEYYIISNLLFLINKVYICCHTKFGSYLRLIPATKVSSKLMKPVKCIRQSNLYTAEIFFHLYLMKLDGCIHGRKCKILIPLFSNMWRNQTTGAYKNTNRPIFKFAEETHNSMQNFTVNLFLSFCNSFDCSYMVLSSSH